MDFGGGTSLRDNPFLGWGGGEDLGCDSTGDGLTDALTTDVFEVLTVGLVGLEGFGLFKLRLKREGTAEGREIDSRAADIH